MLGDVIYPPSIEFLHRVCLNTEFDSRLVEMVKVVEISLLGSGRGRNSISYRDIYFILAYPSHVQIESSYHVMENGRIIILLTYASTRLVAPSLQGSKF